MVKKFDFIIFFLTQMDKLIQIIRDYLTINWFSVFLLLLLSFIFSIVQCDRGTGYLPSISYLIINPMISTKNLVSFNLTIYLIGLKIFKKDINEFNKKRDLIISILLLISCLSIHNIKLVNILFILRHYYDVYNLSPIPINILDSVSWSLIGDMNELMTHKGEIYNPTEGVMVLGIYSVFIISIEILRLYILSYFVWIEYDTKRKALLRHKRVTQPGCDDTEDLSPVKKDNNVNHTKTKLEYIYSILNSTLTPRSNKTKKDIKYY